MIVVDCTTISYLLLPCEHTADVEALLGKYPVWASVSLWEAEFASVLSKHEKHRGLSPVKSIELIDHALQILGKTEFNIPIQRVLEVARRTGCSTYDSYYVALAEDLGTLLFTYDEELLKKCPGIARKP
jgi:predicted nucleic acid-binding protein